MKINLIPYNTEDRKEAEEVFDIINENDLNSPWPLTVERIMTGGVRYFQERS